MQTPSTNDRHFWLDLIRGVSALLVCASHLRAAVLIDYNDIALPNPFYKIFYWLTGSGHQAVIVFFVLSGYLVGGSVIRNRSNFSWLDYGIARLSRLWTVLIPCLLLTLIFDEITRSIAPGIVGGAYSEIWHSAPRADEYSVSIATFLGNIFFLQHIITKTYGTNGALWSLANEWWYYATFPLLVLAFQPKYATVWRIASGAFGILILLILPIYMSQLFLVWLMGALIHVLPKPHLAHARLFTIATFFATIAAMGLSKTQPMAALGEVDYDLFVGICFSAFFYFILGSKNSHRNRYAQAFSTTTSEISYSLYLSHLPAALLIGAIFFKDGRLQPDGIGFMIFFGLFATLLVLGYLVWWVFERNTHRVRRLMQNFFRHPTPLTS